LANPIRSGAMQCATGANQWKGIPPYVRRRWVPCRKSATGASDFPFPVRQGRTRTSLGKYNIVRDFHYLLLEFVLENTVSKTMSLKRSARGLRSTFMRRIAPSQEARRIRLDLSDQRMNRFRRGLELRRCTKQTARHSSRLLPVAGARVLLCVEVSRLKSPIRQPDSFTICRYAADMSDTLQSLPGVKDLSSKPV